MSSNTAVLDRPPVESAFGPVEPFAAAVPVGPAIVVPQRVGGPVEPAVVEPVAGVEPVATVAGPVEPAASAASHEACGCACHRGQLGPVEPVGIFARTWAWLRAHKRAVLFVAL
jgi:hypothetical protein